MTPGSRLQPGEERALAAAGAWMLAGLFADGWAHSTLRPDSFFTPWHAALYSGFLAAAAIAIVAAWRRMPGTRPTRSALPAGHGVTLAGLALFGVGGALDLAWHEVFGIELGVSALLSPTHLLLLTGGLLALTGPLRQAWAEPVADSWSPVISLLFVGAVGLFFTSFASPFSRRAFEIASTTLDLHDLRGTTPDVAAQATELWAVSSAVATTLLLVLPAAALLARFRPPPWALTALFGTMGLLESATGQLAYPLVGIAGVVAGTVADLLRRRGHRSPVVLSAAIAVFWAAAYLAVMATGRLVWAAEVWSGLLVLCTGLGAGVGLIVDAAGRSDDGATARPAVAGRPARAADRGTGQRARRTRRPERRP